MRMSWALGGAIAAAAVLALAGARRSNSVSPAAPALGAVAPELPDNAPVDHASADSTPAVQGEVLETLPVAKYTYLRLATAAGEVWAAVPSAVVALHSQVRIADATAMQDFKSTTLKRTFKVIYFGTLAGATAAPAGAVTAPELRPVADNEPLPPGHPDLGSASNAGSLPPDHPGLSEAAPFDAPPQPAQLAGGPASSLTPLADPPTERASGKNAYLIAELVATRSTLAGRPVRVRGQVTKVTDVQDHAFFHVRDASLGPDGKPADLVVTSTRRPTRGDIAIFEGVLRTDVDVGIGYKYPALLENATISNN